jgi:lipid-A-disaccharide synthase
MKYYLIAGEASGDLHGSNLMKQLIKEDNEAQFRFFGGELMQAVSNNLSKHYREMAFMGIWEVVANLRKIKKNFRDCKADLLDFKPDCLVLIDYPGFNLRMARFAHEHGIKVFYYISPKAWAWKRSRVYTIKKYVDKLFSIIPFEVDFYKQYDYEVEFIGNPTIDALETKYDKSLTKETFLAENKLSDKPIIALVAGSRKQEINLCLPEMVEASKQLSDYQYVVAGAPSVDYSVYEPYIKGTNIKLVDNKTYDLLRFSEAAMVTSGTATLETALLNIPQVVIYKASKMTNILGQFFIKIGLIHVKFFALVNVIVDRMLVQEYYQHNLADKMVTEMKKILKDKSYREQLLIGYKEMSEIIGGPGASARVASRIVELMKA